MTASERAAEINKGSPDGAKLCEDQAHWSEYQIETGEELDQYLDAEAYVNVYKDRYGVKPRSIPSPDRISEEIKRISRANEKTQSAQGKPEMLDPWKAQLKALGERMAKNPQ